LFDSAGFAISQDNSLADKLAFGIIELSKNRGRSPFRTLHCATRFSGDCRDARSHMKGVNSRQKGDNTVLRELLGNRFAD
jgi:hypothetical protein